MTPHTSPAHRTGSQYLSYFINIAVYHKAGTITTKKTEKRLHFLSAGVIFYVLRSHSGSERFRTPLTRPMAMYSVRIEEPP
jgi:hypothetical protein